ncbi:hypothetical protein B0A52_01810 [Exophiala mesophila]|uniref:Uncharacterized protein n=1 Tax=Exophiala mesophila TaxID=212818 RepID=A0A438NG29_EXOME|nr:hypothetical protein B0A52_01810 [Exophiala mesophila]
MRPSSCLLTALTIAGASAGDVGKREPQWKDWEKTEKETVTVWETQWEKPETVLVTEWETKWAKPDAITVYSTVWSTQWHNQSITVTSTSTDILTATESIYVTNTATELYTETQQQIETKTATATVTSANVVHVTQLATVTDTVTKFETCSTTKSLVGLVTCPSRTINPTYTAPTTLPSNYLWGCPPGTICTPKQIDCNFEQNLPSDEFVCSPDECLAVKPLPPLPVDWDPHNCTPYYPPEGYFNLAPPIFGLDYDIFAFNGQPGPSCPPEPSSTSTGWQDWPAPASQTKGWNSWEPAKPGRVNGWKGWNGNGFPHGGRPAPPGITARAVYVERQTGPDMSVPDGCYNICNAAAANGQSCTSDFRSSGAITVTGHVHQLLFRGDANSGEGGRSDGNRDDGDEHDGDKLDSDKLDGDKDDSDKHNGDKHDRDGGVEPPESHGSGNFNAQCTTSIGDLGIRKRGEHGTRRGHNFGASSKSKHRSGVDRLQHEFSAADTRCGDLRRSIF